MRESVTRQELQCTNCNKYVQFDMDFEKDGNHEIICPECQHVHYRIVKNGRITEDRYQSSAGFIIATANCMVSLTSQAIYQINGTGLSWKVNGTTGTTTNSTSQWTRVW